MKFYLLLSLLLAVNCSLCDAAGNLKGSRIKQTTVTENQIKTLTKDPKKERAIQVLQGLAKSAGLEAKKSSVRASSKKGFKNLKPASHATDSKSNDIHAMDDHEPVMIDVSLDDLTTTGWGIQKVRPNADCTGKVRYQIGTAMGTCTSDEEGTSFYLACDDSVEDYRNIRQVYFGSSEDCTGDYTVYSLPDFGGNENPRCHTAISLNDPEFLFEEGYATISSSCRAKSSLDKFEGIVMTTHTTDDCSGAAFSHIVIRNGGCQLNILDGSDDDDESDDGNTTADHDDEDDDEMGFEYLKYYCDAESDTLQAIFYADAQCEKREIDRFEFDLAEVFEGEYKQCILEEDDDSEEEDTHEDVASWVYMTCNSN